MTARVAVVGSLNMDLVARAPRIPLAGETIIGGDFRTVPGGKGANQAVTAARLGAQVSMVGCVGSDAFGGSLVDNLGANGVDHTFVRQSDGVPTGVALIFVDDSGQNSIVVAPGANMQLTPAAVEAASAAIGAADVLLLQLESPLESVSCAAKIARASGVTVILNPAPARSVPARLLSMVDVLIPNESETGLMTGRAVIDLPTADAAARLLREAGVGTVILTLGERGALLAREESTEHFPAFEVTAVDTTAAGDAFVGGFAVALAEGSTLTEAVRWGNAAGALAATKMGAQPSLPTRSALKTQLSAGLTRTA